MLSTADFCCLSHMLRKMKTFYYFGFGSNLLQKRIQISNKSAVRYAIGKLVNHKLDFADASADEKYYSKNWNGCPATIIENEGSTVFGAVWKIDDKDLDELDRQEGVECGIYKPMEVKVLINGNEEIHCRTYQLVHNPPSPIDPENRPFERQPSKTYLNVILNGAHETGLPADYIAFLRSFKHNGNLAINIQLVAQLNLKEML